MSAEVVTIARLGAQGDGVAESVGGEVFVPGALQGEQWRLGLDGATPERLSDSPDRKAAICRHYGVCGGCIAQHMSNDLYRRWKLGIVQQAFAHRGIDIEVAALEVMRLHSRRRAVLGIANRGDRVEIGFREGGQHRLVDMVECPVLDSRIVVALPGLRRLAKEVVAAGTGGRLTITATETGLDVSLSTGKIALTPVLRSKLAGHATSLEVARLAVEGEEIAGRAQPQITLGDVVSHPPNGVFLQAVPEAERRIAELVLAGIGKAKRVADLFCGIGTLTFPLARKAEVLAVDDDKAALAAMADAQRTAQGIKPVTAKRRDLFREPLSPMELAGLDAVVLDPPRAGAKEQCEAIARSKVKRVVAVSCNPATLARDVRILMDAGFTPGTVTPIDQFLFSPHVEAVVILTRK